MKTEDLPLRHMRTHAMLSMLPHCLQGIVNAANDCSTPYRRRKRIST
jgi:hypothetical protein